jgi:hypothetical protein
MLPFPKKKNSYHARPQKACMIRPKTKYFFGYHPKFFFSKKWIRSRADKEKKEEAILFVFSSPPRLPRSHLPTYI